MTATDQAPAPAPWPPAAVALDLARQMVAEWRAIGARATAARRSDDRTATLRLEIEGAGRQQMEAARLAAWFATVSIAEDLHQLRHVFLGEAWTDPATTPLANPGAVDDARATREHMRRWAAGDERHRDEEP